MEYQLTYKTLALQKLCQEASTPFPNRDIRRLTKRTTVNMKQFIPDLDVYTMEIAGYCNWERRRFTWTDEKIGEVLHNTRLSFYERYPNYRPLRKSITRRMTPHLYEEIENYETLRSMLRSLLHDMLEERRQAAITL